MKRLAVLASIVAAGLTAAGLSAQGPPALPPIGEIEQVTERVWKIYGAGGNTTVFVRADGVALVDTKLASNGAAILAQVRKVTDKPVTLIINTHSHGDHVGSNSEIASGSNIEIVAHDNTATRMEAMATVDPPTLVFGERMTVGEGADRIELRWFGAGHTDGDAFVVIPAERVMATGDIFQMLAMPRIDRASGGSTLALPETMSQAQNRIAGVDKVIDGHGTTIHDWAGFRSYVAFTRAVADAARQAETPEQALAALEINAATKPFVDDAVLAGARGRALNALNAAFQELRGEPPAPPASPPAANR